MIIRIHYAAHPDHPDTVPQPHTVDTVTGHTTGLGGGEWTVLGIHPSISPPPGREFTTPAELAVMVDEIGVENLAGCAGWYVACDCDGHMFSIENAIASVEIIDSAGVSSYTAAVDR